MSIYLCITSACSLTKLCGYNLKALLHFLVKVIICTSFGYDIHQLFFHLSMNPRDSSEHIYIISSELKTGNQVYWDTNLVIFFLSWQWSSVLTYLPKWRCLCVLIWSKVQGCRLPYKLNLRKLSFGELNGAFIAAIMTKESSKQELLDRLRFHDNLVPLDHIYVLLIRFYSLAGSRWILRL